ncbi:NAD(P)-dependent oxidoreductase [Agromyces sp. SYSU T00194]|uniref:NAD(P)-dependent oxidoreductase n=1 Tax=Agromyces chitinivorans TaxID=3158560 RepID=UPI0033914431
MAHIAVLGATGRTGREIVVRALAKGHHVTALVRRPDALGVEDEHLSVVVGDATDRDAIDRVLDGVDAVVSSLGRPAAGFTRAEIDDGEEVYVCETSTRHLFDLGPAHGVDRMFFMSTHGAGTSNDGSPYVVRLLELVGNRVVDKDRMEAFLAASDAPIRWTVCRNPYIYEGPVGQPHGVHESIELDSSSQVTYADLAEFAIGEVLDPQYAGKFLTITEPLDPARRRPQ